MFVGWTNLTKGVTCEILVHLLHVISHDKHLRTKVIEEWIIVIITIHVGMLNYWLEKTILIRQRVFKHLVILKIVFVVMLINLLPFNLINLLPFLSTFISKVRLIRVMIVKSTITTSNWRIILIASKDCKSTTCFIAISTLLWILHLIQIK